MAASDCAAQRPRLASPPMSVRGARVFTLGHSPDPDDAFMFYAMAEHKIDLRGYEFKHQLEDIQTLNERAMRGELDISAISIHAYAYVSDRYALLPCGASMGDGYGPMLVATDPDAPTAASPDELRDWLRGRLIAVPGKMTSAFLSLQLFLGEFEHRGGAVRSDLRHGQSRTGGRRPDHSRRPAYLRRARVSESCSIWANGGRRRRVCRCRWAATCCARICRRKSSAILPQITRESIDYGLAHRDAAVRHSLPYARDMDAELAGQFIGMYVNDYTRDYGQTGRAAIREFLRAGSEAGFVPVAGELEFVE